MSSRAVAVDAYLLLGRLAVKYKHITPEQLKQAVVAQEAARTAGTNVRLGDVLRKHKLMQDAQCEELIAYQSQAEIKHEGTYFGYLALVNGFVNKQQLAAALRAQSRKRKASEPVPRLGQIFLQESLMTEGQVAAILGAQVRLRDRFAKESGDDVDITATGRIPALGEKAAAALARLAEFEKSLGAPVEVDVTSDSSDAIPKEWEGLLPDTPTEFVRTDSSAEDIQIRVGPPSDGAVPSYATTEKREAATGFGLNLDDADDVHFAADSPAPPAAPAAGSSRPTVPKSMPKPRGTTTARSKADGGEEESSSGAAQKRASRTTGLIQAAMPAGSQRATTVTAPPPPVGGFRGRRQAPPGASEEFKAPKSEAITFVLVMAAVGAVIVGIYLLTGMLLGT